MKTLLTSRCINQRGAGHQQFSGTEIRLKLVWLCWYDLMLRNGLTDWIESLKFKSEPEIIVWISNRQAENEALKNAMDEYVTFACRMVVAL